MNGKLPRTLLFDIQHKSIGKRDEEAEGKEPKKCKRIGICAGQIEIQHNNKIKNTENGIGATSAAKGFFKNRNQHMSFLSVKLFYFIIEHSKFQRFCVNICPKTR